jgi:hypothetical protein
LLDGEIAIFDADGHSDFGALQGRLAAGGVKHGSSLSRTLLYCSRSTHCGTRARI